MQQGFSSLDVDNLHRVTIRIVQKLERRSKRLLALRCRERSRFEPPNSQLFLPRPIGRLPSSVMGHTQFDLSL